MKSLKSLFFKVYPANKKIIEYFELATGCEFSYENITRTNLHLYVDNLKINISNNSARTYCSKVKSVLKRVSDTHKFPKDFEKILTIRNESSQHTWLNESDIKKLITHKPANLTEQIVKDHFLLGVFTGARHSDYVRFGESNIRDGFLTYTSIKTGITASVPINRTLRKIIKRLGGVETKKVYSEPYFNKIIKNICRDCGIDDDCVVYIGGEERQGEKWRFVSSHTARRSFCTNLFMNDADILDISKMCGHSSITMTCRYICCPPKVDKKVMKYLNSFDAFELG